MKIKNLLSFDNLLQFIKFGIVGVSNTAISYGTEMLMYYCVLNKANLSDTVKIILVTAVAFVLSVCNSYFWNNRYVFKSAEKRTMKEHAVAFFKMTACYAFTGLLLSPVIKIALTNKGIPFWIASLLTLIISVPLNYLLNKFWTFSNKRNKSCSEENQ